MGYRPPPPPPEYGGDCNRFAPGTTPKRFVAFFASIEFCHDLWEEGQPSPPMSMVLEQGFEEPCTWRWNSGFWDVVFDLSIPGWSVLNFTWKDLVYIFEGVKAGTTFGFNNLADRCRMGIWHGYDGAGSILARAETTAPSLSKLCVLAGIPDDIDTKCDVMPVDKDTADIRFFRPEYRIHHHMRYIIDETY